MISLKNIIREILLDLLSLFGNLFFLFAKKPEIEAEKIKKILIVKLYALGDCVYAMPMVPNLRHNFPNAKIYWLVKKYCRAVVEHIEGVDEILEWQGARDALKIIQAEHFDLVFSTYRSSLAHLLLWLARIPIRVGFNWRGRGFSLTHQIKFCGDILESDRYLKLIEGLGLPIKTRRRYLIVGKTEKNDVEKKLIKFGVDLKQRPLVGIFAGGGDNPQLLMPMKRWAADRFAQVVRYLVEDQKIQVILLGNLAERSLAEAVAEMSKVKVLNLAGKTRLNDLVAILNLFDLIIAIDTGPLHIATALGVSTIGLFGPSNPDILVRQSSKNIVIRKETKKPEYVPEKVFLRNFAGSLKDPIHPSMMKIEVNDVIESINKLLPNLFSLTINTPS